ncbi:MAG: hypothetical protein MUE81_09645 [Thermoflexibacter sp.]|nr:hypothetical protein [Thermoflexibacter sp.]
METYSRKVSLLNIQKIDLGILNFIRKRYAVHQGIFFSSIFLLLHFFASFTNLTYAQNLSGLGDTKPVTLSGGFSSQGTFYNASGIASRRDPFFWMLNGNVNINLYGIDIPISVTFTQQQRNFTQPFNQFGLSPTYKGVTAHLGYRSLNFSQFSLSGNVFLGAGIEVAPQNSFVRGTILYGRFVRAVPVGGIDGLVTGVPAYERMGYGAKIGLGRNPERTVELMFFKAKDDENTVNPNVAATSALSPAENLVIGLVGKQQLTKRLFFDVDYAFSAYTKDIRLGRSELDSYKSFNNLGSLFTPNASSQFNNAIHSNLSYRLDNYEFKVSYRRIDPEFKSMGAIFLNNDLEDITGGFSLRALQNKLTFSANGGIQRNNLNSDLLSRLTRGIWALNIAYAPNQKFSLNASYNNFASSTRLVQVEELDSLFYSQVTRSAGFGINYLAGTSRVKHLLFSNLNYQAARDNNAGNSTFYSLATGYQYNIVPLAFNITASFNINNNTFGAFDNLTVGPALAVNKAFLQKKMKVGIATTLVNLYNTGVLSSRNINIRLVNNYIINKHHTLSFNINWLDRSALLNTVKSFNEFRGSLGYNYRF